MPLTELAIKNLKPKEKSYRIADSNGLCLRLAQKGANYGVGVSITLVTLNCCPWKISRRIIGTGQKTKG